MEINTFEKWNSLGFNIKKGSKAICFIEEVPYFNKEQVEKNIKNTILTIMIVTMTAPMISI